MSNVRKRIKPKAAFQCMNYENKLQRMVTKVKTVKACGQSRHCIFLLNSFCLLFFFFFLDGNCQHHQSDYPVSQLSIIQCIMQKFNLGTNATYRG